MTGRRSHQRFGVVRPWDGVMRILRDVVIDQTSENELMAVSQAPGISGETMTLDLIGGGLTVRLSVNVLESRPVIVGGAVRHRLRLAYVRAGSTVGAESVPFAGDLAVPAEAR